MDELHLFKKKYNILQDVSRALVEIHDIRSISDVLLDRAITYTNAEAGSLMLFNDRNYLYILTARGLDPQFVSGYQAKLGEGIAGTVAQNRIPVLVEDIDTDTRFQSMKRDHYRTKTFISCPIMSRNKLLGILNINDKKNGSPFSAEEFDLLQVIANHAALALENVFLLNQLQSKAAELARTNKKLIDTYILKNEFLFRISHELRTPLNAVKGAIYYLCQKGSSQKGERKELHDVIATETDRLISLVENLLNFLRVEDESRLTDKTILNLKDVLQELDETRSIRNALAQKGLDLKVAVADDLPDIVGDKFKVTQLFMNLIEGLCFYLEKGDRIEIDVQVPSDVSVTVTVSKKLPRNFIPTHTRLMDVFRSEQEEHRLKLYLAWNIIEVHHWALAVENVGSGSRITLSIPKSSSDKLNTLLDLSMDSFAELVSDRLNVDICSIMLGDALTNELTVRAARGLDEGVIRRTCIHLGDKIAGWVALEGKPLFIEDIERDPRFARKNHPQYTTKSLMSFPLKVGNKVVGVMNLSNKKTQSPFTAQEYAIAETISEKISTFLERFYTGNYREEEIQELMTSIHDSLPDMRSEAGS